MFITYVSTTCFGAYGHLQVDELTKIHKQLHLACVFYTEDGGGGGYWVGVGDLGGIGWGGGGIGVCIMLI
jgi:hypothetical protein